MRTVLIAAQSLDGFIARHDEAGVAWASAADQAWFRQCLPAFDCQVMGRTTYQTVREVILAKRSEAVRRVVMTRSSSDWRDDETPGALDFTADSATEIAAMLQQQGRQNCAILGGGHVHDAFLDASLVDELWITVEPRIFGQGTPLVHTRHDLKLSLISHTRLDGSDSVVLRYSIDQ